MSVMTIYSGSTQYNITPDTSSYPAYIIMFILRFHIDPSY